MSIDFVNDVGQAIIRLVDRATSVVLVDDVDGQMGVAETPPYPFSDMKTYNIVFEVLETKWKVIAYLLSLKKRKKKKVRKILQIKLV